MANSVGEGLGSPAIEQDPSVAQIQAQQLGAQQAIAVSLPAVGFVGSLNGLTGLLSLAQGANINIASDGVATLTINVIGLATAATAKSNITNSAPTAGNDESEGYSQLSLWLDTSIPNFYLCAANTTAAAVWVLIG